MLKDLTVLVFDKSEPFYPTQHIIFEPSWKGYSDRSGCYAALLPSFRCGKDRDARVDSFLLGKKQGMVRLNELMGLTVKIS